MLASAGDETVLFDTRNNKEVIVGHFARADNDDGHAGAAAVNPKIRFFSEYAKYVDDNVETFKNKRVMMYCST
jgi:predicted sulfurtransferase